MSQHGLPLPVVGGHVSRPLLLVGPAPGNGRNLVNITIGTSWPFQDAASSSAAHDEVRGGLCVVGTQPATRAPPYTATPVPRPQTVLVTAASNALQSHLCISCKWVSYRRRSRSWLWSWLRASSCGRVRRPILPPLLHKACDAFWIFQTKL